MQFIFLVLFTNGNISFFKYKYSFKDHVLAACMLSNAAAACVHRVSNTGSCKNTGAPAV